jgi:hypothetical protein
LFVSDLLFDRAAERASAFSPVGEGGSSLAGERCLAGAVRHVGSLDIEHYHPNEKRWWVRLHEKGGKRIGSGSRAMWRSS